MTSEAIQKVVDDATRTGMYFKCLMMLGVPEGSALQLTLHYGRESATVVVALPSSGWRVA